MIMLPDNDKDAKALQEKSKKMEQANALWENGKKDEAIEIYASEIESSERPDALSVKRTAEYHFEKDDKERATHFVNLAVENWVKLSLEPKELHDICTKAETTRDRKLKEKRLQGLAEQKAKAAESLKKELDKFPLSGNTPEVETRKLRHLIVKAVSRDNMSFEINDRLGHPTQKIIQVRWQISDNLTNRLMRRGAMMDIEAILKAVDESGIACFEVKVSGNFPLVEKFGNTSNSVVTKATYKGSTIQRINWPNFITDDVYNIADDAWFHPAFLK